MRSWLVLAVLGALVAPAAACPLGTACVTATTGPSAELPRPSPRRVAAATLVVRARPVEPRLAALHRSLVRDAPAAATSDHEMPWIWRVLCDEVYRQLPRFEPQRRFTVVLSPVVVSTQRDTVPGVGLSGAF